MIPQFWDRFRFGFRQKKNLKAYNAPGRGNFSIVIIQISLIYSHNQISKRKDTRIIHSFCLNRLNNTWHFNPRKTIVWQLFRFGFPCLRFVMMID